MPSDTCAMNHKQRAYFNFTSDGVGDVARDEPGQLLSTSATDYPGVVYDFPNQVIKLRIGKVIEMQGRKSKLEYQFITPAVTHEKVVPVRDNRTAQCTPCCLACYPLKSSKRAMLSLPLEDEIMDIKSTSKELKYLQGEDHHIINLYEAESLVLRSETMTTTDEYLLSYPESLALSTESFSLKEDNLANSLCTIRSKRRSVSFSDKVDYVSKSCNSFTNYPRADSTYITKNVFGKEEMVYMTLFKDYYGRRTSGTQATASINKCLQVCSNTTSEYASLSPTSLDWSSFNIPIYQDEKKKFNLPEQFRYSDIYFFGNKRKADANNDMGMGASESTTKTHKFGKPDKPERTGKASTTTGVQAKSANSTSGAQTTKARVSIQDGNEKTGRGQMPEMMATVSHIRIGPREPCPIQGAGPCIGPRCVAAVTEQENQEPVKVTTATNPRRGVFEIVIRKMTGAPLAKNELMLEWTPPPSRPPPCGPPCGSPCGSPCGIYGPPSCRLSKCRTRICRPPPCKIPKCTRRTCRKPCGSPCGSTCGSPCGRPCRPRPCSPRPCSPRRCSPRPCRPLPCKTVPCRPAPCRPVRCQPLPCRVAPCRPTCVLPALLSCRRCCKSRCGSPCSPPSCQPPCGTPCWASTCSTPCKSSPCLRPCPVGYRRPRRCRSQPKVRPYRKLISPCRNRSRTCQVVRCRSGPCFSCCGSSPCPARRCSMTYICPSRKICPVFPCPPRRCCRYFPLKTKCCASSCSTGCNI